MAMPFSLTARLVRASPRASHAPKSRLRGPVRVRVTGEPVCAT
jgi:hypothetical protein